MRLIKLPDDSFLNPNHVIRVAPLVTMIQFFKGNTKNMMQDKIEEGFQTAVFITDHQAPMLVKDTPNQFLDIMEKALS